MHSHSSPPSPPPFTSLEDARRYCFQLYQAIQALIADSNVFTGTLRQSQTTSAFKHPEIGVGSIVLPMPTTANATTAWATMRQSATENGMVTFTHASTADADKTFRFAIFGGQKPRVITAS